MSKMKEGRAARRQRSAGVDDRLKDRIKIDYSYPSQPLPDFEEAEQRFAVQFPAAHPEIASQWKQVGALHRSLIERRAALDEKSDQRVALDLLGTKAFCDARGAQLLLERGYAMASLGPLRAAQEGTDLMGYLLIVPEDAKCWLDEDPKFDNLGWVRKKLPVDPTPFHDFLSWGMHANWRLIPHMMRTPGSPLDTEYEINPGPVHDTSMTELLSAVAVFQALRVVASLHDHAPPHMSELWRDQFHACLDRNSEMHENLQTQWRERAATLSAVAAAADVHPVASSGESGD